jgi:hypothetical protein
MCTLGLILPGGGGLRVSIRRFVADSAVKWSLRGHVSIYGVLSDLRSQLKVSAVPTPIASRTGGSGLKNRTARAEASVTSTALIHSSFLFDGRCPASPASLRARLFGAWHLFGAIGVDLTR